VMQYSAIFYIFTTVTTYNTRTTIDSARDLKK